MLRGEIGQDVFAAALEGAQEMYAYADSRRAMKSPLVVQHILREAARSGRTSETLKAIVGKALELIT